MCVYLCASSGHAEYCSPHTVQCVCICVYVNSHGLVNWAGEVLGAEAGQELFGYHMWAG